MSEQETKTEKDDFDVDSETAGDVARGNLTPEALKNILDSNVIGGALAVGLTKQLSIEFEKDGRFLRKLLTSPVKGVGIALSGLAESIEKYNIAVITKARQFTRETGGILTDAQALRSVADVRRQVGGSLARLGMEPEEVLESLKDIRGEGQSLIRFLGDDKTVNSLAAFESQLKKLGVKTDFRSIRDAFIDINTEQGPEVVKRIKQITAAALKLNEGGLNLKQALPLVFKTVGQFAKSGNFEFSQLLNTVNGVLGTFQRAGVEVPQQLGKVLPSFSELFTATRRLSQLTRGETIDPREFINLRANERFEAIFQAFRRAQARGRFTLEEGGIGRDQQIVQAAAALQNVGIGQDQIRAIFRSLEAGDETITGRLDTEQDPTTIERDVRRRIIRSRSMEDIRRQPVRDAAERQVFTRGGIRTFGGAITRAEKEIADILKQRGEVFNQVAAALGKNSVAFFELTQVIQAFTGIEGDPGKEGLIAFALLGPKDSFKNTTQKIKDLSKSLEPVFDGLAGIRKDKDGNVIESRFSNMLDNPVIKNAAEALQKFEEAKENFNKILGEQFKQIQDLKTELETLKDKLKNAGIPISAADGVMSHSGLLLLTQTTYRML